VCCRERVEDLHPKTAGRALRPCSNAEQALGSSCAVASPASLMLQTMRGKDGERSQRNGDSGWRTCHFREEGAVLPCSGIQDRLCVSLAAFAVLSRAGLACQPPAVEVLESLYAEGMYSSSGSGASSSFIMCGLHCPGVVAWGFRMLFASSGSGASSSFIMCGLHCPGVRGPEQPLATRRYSSWLNVNRLLLRLGNGGNGCSGAVGP
jgi:hypothetical protein